MESTAPYLASNKSFAESNNKSPFAIKAGNLKLQLNNPKNVFYAEDVSVREVIPDYEKLIGIQKVGFDDGSFGTKGKPSPPRKVDIKTKDTIIGGYYQDTMPVTNLMPYQVKIYITYETEE